MKTIVLAMVMAFPALAFGQSDYAVTWSITGGIGSNDYKELRLDINEGSRYLAVNGILVTAANSATPATGTCMLLTSGNITCTMSVSSAVYSIEVSSDLNGTIRQIDQGNGTVASSAALKFVSLQ